MADGLSVALLAYVGLAFVGAMLVVVDDQTWNTQLQRLTVGYGLASVLVGTSLFSPRVLRAVLVLAGGVVTAAVPIVIGWELVAPFGLKEAVISQSWTFVVLFPLALAVGAAGLVLRGGSPSSGGPLR